MDNCPPCLMAKELKISLDEKPTYCRACYQRERTENAKLREALERIQIWSKAYPLKVFPKPDLKKVRKMLKAAGITLDAISADAMRHVIDGVKDIMEKALKK